MADLAILACFENLVTIQETNNMAANCNLSETCNPNINTHVQNSERSRVHENNYNTRQRFRIVIYSHLEMHSSLLCVTHSKIQLKQEIN